VNDAGRRIVVAATACAVLIDLVAVAGWWRWRRVVDELENEPARGVIALAESPWLRLPSAVHRFRRLPARALGAAPDELVVSALTAVAGSQLIWTPADANGFKNLARARLIQGLLEDAAVDLERAVTRDPTSPGLHRLVALAERARGRQEATLDHLATAEGLATGQGLGAVELTPEDADWVRLEGLERRIELYPRARVRGLIALARELRGRGDDERGRRMLEPEVQDPRVALELAEWDLGVGRPEEAEHRLDAVLARQGLPAALRAQAWATMATVRDAVGDLEGARAAARESMRLDPGSAAPYRVLAALAERRGDTEDALLNLRQAWGLNPTDVSLLLAVASTAERAGRYDDARLALERAVGVDPENPALRVRLVAYQLRRRDLMDATLTLSAALDRFPTDPGLSRLADRLRSEVNRR
jgi:tetratricopeptide (TPR) repeat protein